MNATVVHERPQQRQRIAETEMKLTRAKLYREELQGGLQGKKHKAQMKKGYF